MRFSLLLFLCSKNVQVTARKCEMECSLQYKGERKSCLPGSLNRNLEMCGRLHCCIDEETGECYRRLPQVKSGCASYCDIPHRNVTACDAENEDSCVEMGCCWFPVSDRPPCYEPAAYVPPTTQNPINRPKAVVRSPYYYSSIVSSKPAEIKNPLIVGYAWADWVDSVCTADCNGVGVKIRRRTCTAYTKYGNSPVNRNFCKGPDKKAELCVGPPCSHNDFQITVPTKTDSESDQDEKRPLVPGLDSNIFTFENHSDFYPSKTLKAIRRRWFAVSTKENSTIQAK